MKYQIPKDTWVLRHARCYAKDGYIWSWAKTTKSVEYTEKDIVKSDSYEYKKLCRDCANTSVAESDIAKNSRGVPVIFRVPSSKYQYVLVAHQSIRTKQ